MTSQEDFLQRLVTALNNAGIAYMLSGAIGSGFHGQPRATNDIDIVIAPTETQLRTFTGSLGEDYYVSFEAVREALKNNSMFSVIDVQSSWKADLIICKKRLFSLEEFKRRQIVNIMGLDVWILSPEDVILSKLEWSRNQETGNQFRDALGVAIVQWDNLDRDYLNKWAKELQVESLLGQLLGQAEKLKESK